MKKWIAEEQKREAKTMAQVMTEYERSLEAFGSRHRREGNAEVLCSQAVRRFGEGAGQRLADLLGTPPDSGRLARAEAAILDCSTAVELFRQVDGSSGP